MWSQKLTKWHQKLIQWHQKLIRWHQLKKFNKSRKFLQALHDLNHVDLQYGDHDDHNYGDLEWGYHGDRGLNYFQNFIFL